jgi:hypothetical protein
MIDNLLKPRPEVISCKIQGLIDIERVSDPQRRSLESRTQEFFESTFLTGELRRLISTLHTRLNSDAAEPGLFLLEGPKGVGKPGPSSSRLYQHGGFSLMEVLAPWIELERN